VTTDLPEGDYNPTDVAWRNLTAVVAWLIRDHPRESRRRLLARRLRELADKIEHGETLR
jgi:hypothetical protein